MSEIVTFTREGATFHVPGWAPARIIAAATLKPGAKIVAKVPADSRPWHPALDD